MTGGLQRFPYWVRHIVSLVFGKPHTFSKIQLHHTSCAILVLCVTRFVNFKEGFKHMSDKRQSVTDCYTLQLVLLPLLDCETPLVTQVTRSLAVLHLCLRTRVDNIHLIYTITIHIVLISSRNTHRIYLNLNYPLIKFYYLS